MTDTAPPVVVSVRAPAKINLDLRIVRRRRDGYHDLRTILQSVDLVDTLQLRPDVGRLTIRSRDPAVPRDEDNLIWRAATELWRAVGRTGPPGGVRISITKRIPIAAGLGGGSSDAAAALRGLCAVWQVSPSPRLLAQLASRVGSDVPFFLRGGLALGVARGERIRSLGDLPLRWLVLAVPRFGVSAAAAYSWFDETSTRKTPALPSFWRHRLAVLHNDLQAPVVARHPEIGAVVGGLQAAGAEHAAMTGSGSAVYGLYRRRADAEAARRKIRRPGWRTLLSRTLGRQEVADVMALARSRAG